MISGTVPGQFMTELSDSETLLDISPSPSPSPKTPKLSSFRRPMVPPSPIVFNEPEVQKEKKDYDKSFFPLGIEDISNIYSNEEHNSGIVALEDALIMTSTTNRKVITVTAGKTIAAKSAATLLLAAFFLLFYNGLILQIFGP